MRIDYSLTKEDEAYMSDREIMQLVFDYNDGIINDDELEKKLSNKTDLEKFMSKNKEFQEKCHSMYRPM